MFLDKTQLLALTAPEWVALRRGVEGNGANHDGSANGIFTDRVGVLTNDFFTVLTSMDMNGRSRTKTAWSFRSTTARRRTALQATRNDLIFGSNSQLRAVAEVYASSDGHARFVKDREGLGQVMMLIVLPFGI